MFGQRGYQLLQSDTSGQDTPNVAERKSSIPRYVWYILVACAIGTLANGVALWTFLARSSDEYVRQAPGAPLPRPNQYIGLDTVNRNVSGYERPAPLANYPFLLGQIDAAHPSKVLRYEKTLSFSNGAMIYTEDLHFQVGPQISTIFQARVRDFGMEDCEIRLELSNIAVATVGPDTIIDIWRLSTPVPLDRDHLNHKTSPRRMQRIGTFNASTTRQMAGDVFHCQSDSLQTFEFACTGEADRCSLEFWQNRRKPDEGGVFLRQYATV